MAKYVYVDENKSRGRDVLSFEEAKDAVSNNRTVGFLLEDNLYLLDIDSTSDKAKYVADYIISRYPDIICFKTIKAGGYHFLFRTPIDIKAGVGFITIFGFPMDIKKARGHAILPDNFAGRSYYNGCNDISSFEERMKNYNVFINPQELRDLIPYSKNVKDPIDLTKLEEGTRNDTIFRWLVRWARFRGATELDNYAQVIAKITNFPLKEIRNSIKSIDRYVIEDSERIVEEEIDGIIVGKDLLDVSVNVLDYIKRSGMIQYDICTGNYTTTLKLAHKNVLDQLEMWNYFRIYFKDKARYWRKNKEGETVLKPLAEADLKSIFEFVSKHCTFNSRLNVYENIPEWDGKCRILSFMKEYYDCDANPNFFLLLMTAIVGKLKEPEKCYCPFFFDFCGNKGTGKTLLLKRIAGERYYTTIAPTSREDDVCVNIYSKGAVIAVDDECILTTGKSFNVWSEDKLKNFVTLSEDVFARKFQNVEYHPRGFVLCRTSNFVKSATDTDERRQIIFESKLPPRECRILPDKLPDAYFTQMLAEAKVFYEKYGIYKLTPKDWDMVAIQQSEYIDEENIFTCEVNDFLAAAFNSLSKRDEKYYSLSNQNKGVITWNHYRNWLLDTHPYNKPMGGALFWKNIRIIAQKTKTLTVPVGRIRMRNSGTQVQGAIMDEETYRSASQLRELSGEYKQPDNYADLVDEDIPDLEF